MRWCGIIVAWTLCCTGCTHLALERRAAYQASTTTDLQYRQVLDNLAMFAANPDTLPWHLKLSGASIQVTDVGTANFLDSFAGVQATPAVTLTSQLTAQRGVVNQWSGQPTVDSDVLELLTLAYLRALDPHDADGRLHAALYRKVAEIAVQLNIVLTKDTLDKVIDYSTTLERTRAWQLKRKNEELHDQLNKVFEQVAKLSRPITEIQVDNYAQRLSNKVTEETRGEARAKLQMQQAQQSAQVQQTRISVEDEIVRLTRDVCALPYIPRYPITGRQDRNPHDIALAQNKIKALIDLAESPQFTAPWLCVSRGHAKLAGCDGMVGHYHKLGSRLSVHVPPEHRATLRNFTLIILSLSPIETQDVPSGTPTGTVTYSPTIGAGR